MRGGRVASKFHRPSRILFYGLLASALYLLVYWLNTPLLAKLEQATQDYVARYRQQQPPPPEVVVVDVDEASIKEYGRWPWSRVLQAELIRRLKALDVGTIALDIIYLRPQDEAADRALAEALVAPGAPVVGGYFFRPEQTIPTAPESLAELREQRIRVVRRLPGTETLPAPLVAFPFVETNQPDIATQFPALGFFNVISDLDGLVRGIPLTVSFQGEYYPSLVMAALSQWAGLPVGLSVGPAGIRALSLGGIHISVDLAGLLALSWYREDPVPSYSASDVLGDRVDARALAGRLVFLGVSETGISDRRATPVDDDLPGVMIHATAAANIIDGSYLVRDARLDLFNGPLMAVVPVLLVWTLSRMRRLWAMAAVFLSAVAVVWWGYYWLVAYQGYLASFVYPALALTLGFFTFVPYYILTSQRKNRFLTQAFSSYVSPALVEQLLQDPDRLHLAGEKREITVLFSDIRGFTTISETMAPEQLGELLNRYLGAMSEIIVDQQGTLDKYIGDAVMAIFNAPLDIDHHPRRAVAAALAMFRKLRELNQDFVREFGIELHIGMGLHTGSAIVGNLGSARRFDYTAIGDTVNLGSRLEGITKQYGVDLLISDTTRAALDETFHCRPIDRIRVKGKYAAVEIHEVLDPTAEDDRGSLARAYETALRAYFVGDFADALVNFEALLADFPQDRPSQLMRIRCQQYLEQPPKSWDGVYVALEK